jgi:hypothetical protein
LERPFLTRYVLFREFPALGKIEFQIDDVKTFRATRVATLDELAKAISAIGEDIGRLAQGAPALIFRDFDVERLRQDKAALIELQKRARRERMPRIDDRDRSAIP